MVCSDNFELDFSDDSIINQNFHPVESYDEKTAKNYRNCYVAEKRIFSKLSKLSTPHFDSTNSKPE